MQAWLSLSLVTQLFKFFHKYRPESKAQKRERLRNLAKTKAKGGQLPAVKKIIAVKYGIHNITRLIEQKRAVLVAIAHDVDPIEVEEFFLNADEHVVLLCLPPSLFFSSWWYGCHLCVDV